jgi:hypothetical protein
LAIGDDFTIDYVNKRVYHSSGTTVYSVNALYTWLQDTFDELDQMDDEVPMSAQTPTEYTMINGWFIDDTLVQFLNGGAIQTSGYDNEVRLLFHDNATPFVASDITKTLTGTTTGDTGVILFYTNSKVWVRMADSGDTFDVEQVLVISMLPRSLVRIYMPMSIHWVRLRAPLLRRFTSSRPVSLFLSGGQQVRLMFLSRSRNQM